MTTLDQTFPFEDGFTMRRVIASELTNAIYVIRAKSWDEMDSRVRLVEQFIEQCIESEHFVICSDAIGKVADGFMGNKFVERGPDADGLMHSAHVVDAINRKRWTVYDGNQYSDYGYINVYSVDRAYGGPEEGGWWYERGHPIATFESHNVQGKAAVDLVNALHAWRVEEKYEGLHRARDNDDIRISIDRFEGTPFPKTRPHYE